MMTKSIPFAKFHGLGNDFLVVGPKGLPRALTGFVTAILNRHTGVGADGLLVVVPPRSKRHDARVRFFNADGSEAEMSGNGIRCVGAFLAERSPSKRTFLIETLAGVKSLEKMGGGKAPLGFRVGMGSPVLDPAGIPFKAGKIPPPIKGFQLHTARGVQRVTVTSMGNPHCSVFVKDFKRIDWEGVGRAIEMSPLFPNRTNVEFVRVISRHEIEVRFWERGVGHTMSSGTGSSAATVASILNGLTERQVQVQTEAGSLRIAWPLEGELTLQGPVERIAGGIYNWR